jgi:hypothetical protein
VKKRHAKALRWDREREKRKEIKIVEGVWNDDVRKKHTKQLLSLQRNKETYGYVASVRSLFKNNRGKIIDRSITARDISNSKFPTERLFQLPWEKPDSVFITGSTEEGLWELAHPSSSKHDQKIFLA